MKLSEGKINTEVQEKGDWVDDIPEMAGVRLKVRGSNNADWRKLEARLLATVPRKKRLGGRLDPDEQDRITSECLFACGLLDWEGFENEDGSALAYSKDVAREILFKPEYQRYRLGVMWACNVVAEQRREDTEDIAKN